ncbi:MAG: acyltransferase [Legionella sp.]|uniref:acyltransferase family protein n=1 Tax=Legionella sp. TaxID=459 RepID=UPI002840862E|nr:acyltransferase [Legionella sp.]
MRDLAEVAQGRENNFTLLRLLSAVYVIFCHSWGLLKLQGPLAGLGSFLSISCSLGVLIFFTISGFLVTASYVKNSNPYFYIKSRALRIFPGLLFSLLVTALVIGSIATSMPLKEYLTSKSVLTYIYNNGTLTHLQMNLPGVFENNIYSSAVNGSLWTLPIEFRLYVIICLIGIIGALKKNYIGIPILILSISLFSYPHYQAGNIIVLQAIFSFIIGSLFFLLRKSIRLNYVFLLPIAFLFFMSPSQYKSIFSVFGLSYFAFLIAYSRKLSFSFLDKYGDFSYGLYIFSFPVQQLLIQKVPSISPIGLFLLSLLITLVLSIISWFFIEKPALSLKGKRRQLDNQALNTQINS